MAWKARRHCKIDGVLYSPGDLIPGGGKIPTIRALASLGFVMEVDDRRTDMSREESLEHIGEAARVSQANKDRDRPPLADLSILDNNLDQVEDAVEAIENSDHLRELLDAELAGKTRIGAVRLLLDRLDDIGEPHPNAEQLLEDLGG